MGIRRQRFGVATLLVLSSVFVTKRSGATMLPEDYKKEAPETISSAVDPDLTKWLARFSGKPSIEAMDANKVLTLIKGDEDRIKKEYALARNEIANNDRGKAAVRLAKLVKIVERHNSKRKFHHPLSGFIFADALDLGADVDSEFRMRTRLYLEANAPRSCPHKRDLENILSDRTFLNGDPALINAQLQQLAKVKSYNSRNDIVRRFLQALPKEQRSAVAANLWPVIKDFDHHRQSNSWIDEYVATDAGGGTAEEKRLAAFEKSARIAKKNQCNLASTVFLDELKLQKDSSTLPDARRVATAIGNCLRREGSKKRLAYWEGLVAPFSATYGTAGWAAASVGIAKNQWNLSQNDKALANLGAVISKAIDPSTLSLRTEAEFLSAQILEENGNVDQAIAMYQKFRQDAPTDPMINDALSSLSLIYAGRGDWEGVLEPTEAMIQSQSQLDVDKRDVAVLGFALFWQGRALLELKRTALAVKAWERLSREFYSTYYGAIGHYLLEQMEGKKSALTSSLGTKGFAREAWYNSFSEVDRQRIRSIEMFLELGLKEKATCEIAELVTGDEPQRLVAKALLLHASDNWLDAIQIFSDLPRTFRNTLASGMEMILFPKRYDVSIREYAKRLDLDPDLVFALIRQESVFNPKARSSAGARGLMQLMTPTASIELKKLSSPYVTEKMRQELLRKTSIESSLYEADINLLIGTHHLNRLLKSYQSPVFTLSAYNAGPGAAARWQSKMETNDLLLFIEKIPYKETRGYVKLILRNYFYYSRLYGDQDKPLLHLESVTKVLMASVTAPSPVEERAFH